MAARPLYKGVQIERCVFVPGQHSGSWVVRSVHAASGMLYSDELCPHFGTLRSAKEFIDEALKGRDDER